MRKVSFLALIAVLFISCGLNDDERKADNFITTAQKLIDNNQFESAQQQLDSVHQLFPKLIKKRKVAAALEDTLTRRKSLKILADYQRLLPLKIHEQDSLLKLFRYEKNEKYQNYGNFISKHQLTEQNYNRTYLKCYADENTDIYLISQHSGAPLNHKVVKLSVGDTYVISDTVNINTGEFYSFTDDDGMYFESMTFLNEKAKNLLAFVVNNSTARIKVELKGKKTYSYVLADNDKRAIIESYKLWTVMREVKQMTIEINKANRNLFYINQRDVKSINTKTEK